MATHQYNIGLDFGTYQSKACILHVNADPTKHEFFQFKDPLGHLTYFFPSKVYLMNDDTFNYGFEPTNGQKRVYNYFKIAAVEDEEFQVELENPKQFYRKGFTDMTPETLAVLYITYLLFMIEKYYKASAKKNIKPRGGLLSLLTRKVAEDVIKITIQLGIPTEYSNTVNIKRKRKYENILVLSKLLIEKYESLENYIVQKREVLLNDIRNYVDDFIRAKGSSNIIDLKLEEFGVSVYPEAAAGLTYIVKSGRLEKGFFVALDIGGGSTDISFFRVKPDKTIDYLAAESLLLAANNVYYEILGNDNASLDLIKETEDLVREIIDNDTWKNNRKYIDSADFVKRSLESKVKVLFNQRILLHYRSFRTQYIRDAFEGQPCFIYGGGSLLPSEIDNKRLLIYDSGCPKTGISELLSYMTKKRLEEYIPSEYVLPADGSWKKDIGLLVVAFGLSYLHGDKETFWDDSMYHNRDLKNESFKQVPHPINEGQYIYDVLAQKWY